eukprot:154455_1
MMLETCEEVTHEQSPHENSGNLSAENTQFAEESIVVDTSTASKGTDKSLPDQVEKELNSWKRQRMFAVPWLLYTILYWPLLVCIQAIEQPSLVSGTFAFYVSLTALITLIYACYQGKYPSKKNYGKWIAFGVAVPVLINLSVIISFHGFLAHTYRIDTIILYICCHLVHIFWTSLLFYDIHSNFNHSLAFFLKWVDIAISCVVIFVFNMFIVNSKSCFDEILCMVYFIYIIAELFGWTVPMLQVKWRQTNPLIVAKHIFLLNLVTHLSFISTIIIKSLYKIHPIIIFDVAWKAVHLAQSFSCFTNQWKSKTGRKAFTKFRFNLIFNFIILIITPLPIYGYYVFSTTFYEIIIVSIQVIF